MFERSGFEGLKKGHGRDVLESSRHSTNNNQYPRSKDRNHLIGQLPNPTSRIFKFLSNSSKMPFQDPIRHRNTPETLMRSPSLNSFSPDSGAHSLRESQLHFFRSHASSFALQSQSSIASMDGVDDLKALEARMEFVTECERVSFEDSTTGAHIGLSNDQDSLFIIKSNDECHFELIGNCFADALDLNIPGYAFLSEDFIQLNRFKKMLGNNNDYPLMVSEYLTAINLKEVTPGYDTLDTEQIFKELGKAYLLDCVIGNWDRFPVFAADTEGNYGNVMYQPYEKAFLFIDTVAQKHTELGGYGTDEYLELILHPSASAERIKEWLEVKFPEINNINTESSTRDFTLGIAEGIELLKVRKREIDEILQSQYTQLQINQSNHSDKIHDLINILYTEVSKELTQIDHEKPLEVNTLFEALLQCLNADEGFNDKEITTLIDRLTKGRGIPRVGPLAMKVNQSQTFMAAWQKYSHGLSKESSSNKLKEIKDQIAPSHIRADFNFDTLIEGFKSTSFRSNTLDAFNREVESLEKVSSHTKQMDALIVFFDTICSLDPNLINGA